MADTAAIRLLSAGVDLAWLIGNDTALHRKTKDELAGPCPICGKGTDRLVVSTATQRWWCRVHSTSEHWGSALDYVMESRRLEFGAAMTYLEGIAGMGHTYREPVRPQKDLSGVFFDLAARYSRALWERANDPVREWLLAERGLLPTTVREFGLGLCAPAGGASFEYIHSVKVPRGLVIPLWGVDRKLYGLKVRRRRTNPGERKYQLVAGGHPCLFGRLDPNLHRTLLVEGELDAMLAWQEAGSLANVVTLGSASARMSEYWKDLLLGTHAYLWCKDADEAGTASTSLETDRAVRVVTPPEGKDLTAYHRAGGDLSAWVFRELCALAAQPEKREVAKEPGPEPKLWRPPKGRDYGPLTTTAISGIELRFEFAGDENPWTALEDIPDHKLDYSEMGASGEEIRLRCTACDRRLSVSPRLTRYPRPCWGVESRHKVLCEPCWRLQTGLEPPEIPKPTADSRTAHKRARDATLAACIKPFDDARIEGGIDIREASWQGHLDRDYRVRFGHVRVTKVKKPRKQPDGALPASLEL